MNQWSVVLFTGHRSIEVIPSSWLLSNNKETYWPPFTGIKMTDSIRKRTNPDEATWKVFPIKIINQHDNFKEAQECCNKNLDIDTDDVASTFSEESLNMSAELGRGKRPRVAKELPDEFCDGDDDYLENPFKKKRQSTFEAKNKQNLEDVDELEQSPVCVSNSKLSKVSRSLTGTYLEKNVDKSQISCNTREGAFDSYNRKLKKNIQELVELEDSPQSSSGKSTYPYVSTNQQRCHTPVYPFVTNRQMYHTSMYEPGRESPMELKFDSFYKEYKEFQTFVVRNVKIIEKRIKDQNEYLDLVLKKQPLGTIIDETEDGVIEMLQLFPLKTEDHLNTVEEKLKNASFKEAMAKQFSRKGGSSLKDVCHSLLKEILSNKIAAKYSVEGRKKKMKFKDTELFRMILMSVRMNEKFQNTTDSEFIELLGPWLAGAPFRIQKCNTAVPGQVPVPEKN